MMKIKSVNAKKKKIKVLVYFNQKNTIVEVGKLNTVQYIK